MPLVLDNSTHYGVMSSVVIGFLRVGGVLVSCEGSKGFKGGPKTLFMCFERMKGGKY